VKRTILLAALPLAFAACKKADPAPVYEKVAVERRDITVSASASGAIQPILTVQVKSQASGAVTEMRVQTGDEVHPGQLLAVIDPRLPKSALDQAQASVDQAQAQYDYARAQLAREDTLFHANAVTEQEYQNSRVSFEQAKTALVNAKANLSDATIAYEQTRVTAPLAGTIITKTVDVGTVISSPTHDVTGGTAMFTMANLDTVQVQALVDETDIGKVQPGMPVTITVDAYPNRPFAGIVLKIEPQATVNQNVTMFPVDVNILNPGHLLKPGMNTEVAVHIGDRTNVLAIPNAALRTPRDVASAATVLGLDPNVVQQQLAQAQAPAPAARDSAKGQASLGGNTSKPDTSKGKGPATVTIQTPGGDMTITLLRRHARGEGDSHVAARRHDYHPPRGRDGGGVQRHAGQAAQRRAAHAARAGHPAADHVAVPEPLRRRGRGRRWWWWWRLRRARRPRQRGERLWRQLHRVRAAQG